MSYHRLFCTGILILGSSLIQAQTVIPITNEKASGQLGIYVRLGTNSNPFKYILDTGSAGFFSALGNSTHWTNSISGHYTGDSFNVSYGTGSLSYSGDMAVNTVTLSNQNGDSLLTVPNARMGIITNQPYANWNSDINKLPVPTPPENPDTHLFFGTFGAGLYKTAANNGNAGSILGQVPLGPGLTKGFVVNTGGRNATTGTLTIGLTAEIINSFPILIAMNPTTGNSTNDNGTMVRLYPEEQTTANVTVTHGTDTPYSTNVNLIMDTGGLGTHFTRGASVDPPAYLTENRTVDHSTREFIKNGAVFTLSVNGTTGPGGPPPGQSLDWTIDPVGETKFVNEIGVQAGTHQGSLNSGIALFYEYEVMFDTENGIIGLRPIPEPGVVSLILFALGAATVPALRRRLHPPS